MDHKFRKTLRKASNFVTNAALTNVLAIPFAAEAENAIPYVIATGVSAVVAVAGRFPSRMLRRGTYGAMAFGFLGLMVGTSMIDDQLLKREHLGIVLKAATMFGGLIGASMGTPSEMKDSYRRNRRDREDKAIESLNALSPESAIKAIRIVERHKKGAKLAL